MVEITMDVSTTHKAEKLFAKYYRSFGNIISAEMQNELPKVKFKLILTNADGDKMIIKDGLTSGYVGTGPNGTIRVLKKAGFNDIEDLVYTKDSFILER